MFAYEKKLQYPVNIKQPNPKLAKAIITQLGGPDGELGAALRYLSQRYAMPYGEVSGILTDVGTEELGHVEMISTIVYQLTRSLTPEEIKRSGFDTYFVDHTTGIYPIAASGQPFTASFFQSTGDVITDLTEDLAAEQKARTTYDNILRLADDYDVRDAIRFLRQRELVHFQRFGEAFRTEKFFCPKTERPRMTACTIQGRFLICSACVSSGTAALVRRTGKNRIFSDRSTPGRRRQWLPSVPGCKG